METLCMPELEYLLEDSLTEHYPFMPTWEEAKHHPCLIVHTSGSTGLPKPVTWTHHSLSAVHSHHDVHSLEGRRTIWGGVFDTSQRSFSGLPVFHGTGVATAIRRICYNLTTVVLPPPGLVTADVFDQVLNDADIDSANLIPLTLEEIATRADMLKKLGRLKHVTCVGGE